MPDTSQLPDTRRQQAVAAAIELFWREGYDGVSIGEIVEATGLNRYALYQAFGGKKDLFMACLQSYVEESKAVIRDFLARPDREPADAVFDAIVARMLDPDMYPAGCLICTTAADVAAKDKDVAEMMGTCHAEISAMFIDAFVAAQEAGRAAPDADPVAFAEMASALYFSTGLQARMGRSREDLLDALRRVTDTMRRRPSA